MLGNQSIPARRGTATILKRNQTIKIISTSGRQIIDTWAFGLAASLIGGDKETDVPIFPNANESSLTSYSGAANQAATAPEFSSMSHTQMAIGKLGVGTGDSIYSQKRSKLLTLVEDTSPVLHDTLVPACDRWRYAELGHEGYHESCTDNCWDALQTLADSLSGEQGTVVQGIKWALGGRLPTPLNLFMSVSITGEGAEQKMKLEGPQGKEGDYVVFKAEKDCVVVMSACPQDMASVGGGEPTDGYYEIHEAK
jgi:uncharacterized protein